MGNLKSKILNKVSKACQYWVKLLKEWIHEVYNGARVFLNSGSFFCIPALNFLKLAFQTKALFDFKVNVF